MIVEFTAIILGKSRTCRAIPAASSCPQMRSRSARVVSPVPVRHRAKNKRALYQPPQTRLSSCGAELRTGENRTAKAKMILEPSSESEKTFLASSLAAGGQLRRPPRPLVGIFVPKWSAYDVL